MVHVAYQAQLDVLEVHGFLAGAYTICADVEAEGHSQVLGRGPQWLVLRQVVGPRLGGIYGDHCPDEAHPGAPLQLLHPGHYVVGVEHGDALEPVGEGLAELGEPVVIDPEDVRQQLAVRNAGVELQAGGGI